MRYIDADALIKKIYPMGICDGKYTINAKAVKLAIDNAPTADVVPKSEYDEVLSNWQKIHDSYTADCIDHYNKGRQEVAREIFEEIEKALEEKRFQGASCFLNDLAELKKKYTEGGGENGA